MNVESRITKLEQKADGPEISTWLDLMQYDGTGPMRVSDEMLELFSKVKQ